MGDLLGLNYKERTALEAIIATSHDAKQLQRAQALLWLEEGARVEEIASLLRVTRQVIYKWAVRLRTAQDRPIGQRLAEAARSGRPRTAQGIIDPLIDQVIERDPRDFGYQSTVWTAALLVVYLGDVHHIVVSQRSVSYALERLRIVWKRPRYTLARRSPTWRQAKGGLNAGFLRAPARSS
jgi:transposase